MPKEVFGEEILPAYYETLAEEAYGPWELNVAFLNMWDSTVDTYSWVMPDGFHVHTKVMNTHFEQVEFMGQIVQTERKVHEPTPEGRALGANITHSIDGLMNREMVARCFYNPDTVAKVRKALRDGRWCGTNRVKDKALAQVLNMYQTTGFLSAAVIDLIDEKNVGMVPRKDVLALLDSLPTKSFKILVNHDCFRCHPNHANAMRRQFNRQLKLIAQSDIIGSIVSQITGSHVTLNKMDPSMAAEISEANYALS